MNTLDRMTSSAYSSQLDALRRPDKKKQKQTQIQIIEACKKKYSETEKHLQKLEEKKKKIEDEISHLQQKQSDRKKFLSETK